LKPSKHPGLWVLGLALLQAAIASFPLLIHGCNDTGWHFATRYTARFAGWLFLLVFLASSLRRIWKSRATAWLLRHRRYFGVGFAASMGIHLICIFGIYATSPGFAASLSPWAVAGGALGYAFLATMVLTSTDSSVQRLGLKNWRRLHSTGMYYLWLVFFFTYLGGSSDRYHLAMAWVFGAALIAKLLLKRKIFGKELTPSRTPSRPG